MGASNFARGNTSQVFAVLMNREELYKECTECEEKHYKNNYNEEGYKNLSSCGNCEACELVEKEETVSPESYEYVEFKEQIKDFAHESVKESKFYYIESSGDSDNDRNYPSTELFELRIDKEFGDIEVSIKIVGVITGAYYEGASLDYNAYIYNGGEDCLLENGRYTTTEEDIIKDLFELGYEHSYSNMSQGLRKIQSKNAIKWAEKQVTELKVLIEEIFTAVSQPLNVVASFSNRETIYAKA